MLTWDRIREHLHATYRTTIDEPELVGIAWELERTPAAQQRVLVYPLDILGAPYIQVMAYVGSAMSMSPHDAVVHSGRLSLGAIALVDNAYVMRAALPLAGLTTAALHQALRLLAHQAARVVPQRASLPAPYYE